MRGVKLPIYHNADYITFYYICNRKSNINLKNINYGKLF